jgi:hypothetical protein
VALFALLGVAVGGAQLLPTIESFTDSARAGTTPDFSLTYSMHPLNLLQLWSPYVFPERVFSDERPLQVHEFAIYNGAFCTVGWFWVAARWQAIPHRTIAWAGVAFCAVGVVLALGRYGFVYSLLTHVPLVGAFRGSTRHIALVHLGMAMLAAVAFDDLLRLARQGHAMSSRLTLALVTPVALSVAAGIVAIPFLPHPQMAALQPTWFRVASGAALMLAAARLTALSARGARPALWILPLFVAFDLGPWGYGYMWTTPPATIAQVAASVSAPPFIERGARISFPLGAANCDANAALSPPRHQLASSARPQQSRPLP